MHEIIMGYQGEMSLKGLNRNQFESAMMKILRYRLKTVGKFVGRQPAPSILDPDLRFQPLRGCTPTTTL